MAAQSGTSPIAFQTSKAERTAYGSISSGRMFLYLHPKLSANLFDRSRDYRRGSSDDFLVAKVWDAVNDPLFGVIIDGLSPRAENSCPGCVDL